jgi:peptide/nickel transport system substrate-binding protein
MKKSWLVSLLAMVLVASLLLAACGTAAEPTQVEAPPTVVEAVPTDTPAPPKVATFIWTQEFDTLSPLYTNMWFSSTTFQLWNCYAWNFDDKLEPVPSLVTELPSTSNGGISADSKVITLRLRPDLVWSDGTPLTSADFIFTYEMMVSPKNAVASAYPYDQLEKVEAPDAQTVVMTFMEPFAPWLGSLWHGIIPEHILRPVFDSAGTLDTAEWNKNPTVGCGPYVFKEWESGSFAHFVASDNYWLGKPKIDEIYFKFVPDDASKIAALTTGDGDLGTFVAYSDMPSLEEAGIRIIPAFSGYNEGIYFYLGEKGHPALKELNVRKAIAFGTDRAGICKELLLGGTVPAATDWDGTTYNDPSLEPYPYDPEQAKQLLDEAGWKDSNGDGVRDKDGVELVLTYGTTTREIRKDTQAVLQQNLADVGIKVELMNYESDLFFGSYAEGGPAATGELDMFEYSTIYEFPDPDTSEWLCDQIPTDASPEGNNWQAVCDPTLDDLFSQQRTQVDVAERTKTFHQITKHIFDNVYFLGIWQDPDTWGVGARLQNVKLSGATPLYSIMEWDLTQ